MPVPQSTKALLAVMEEATLRSASWGDEAAELRSRCGTTAERERLAEAYAASLMARGVPSDKASNLAVGMEQKLHDMAEALNKITDACASLYGAAQDLAAVSQRALKLVE